MTCTSVQEILREADKLGRPFTSLEMCRCVGATEPDATKNVSSMMCYLAKRGVLEKVGQNGKCYLYSPPQGMTAQQSHATWLKETAKGYKGPKQKRGGPRSKDHWPMPAFPLGEVWRRAA